MTWKISLSPAFINFKTLVPVYVSTIYKYIVSQEVLWNHAEGQKSHSSRGCQLKINTVF